MMERCRRKLYKPKKSKNMILVKPWKIKMDQFLKYKKME
jgi:hypothetical protein